MGSRSAGGSGLRLERFPAGLEATGPAGGPAVRAEPRADARTAAWFAAVGHGFYGADRTPEAVADLARAYVEDGRELTAVYDDAQQGPAFPADIPVATFATLVKDLNVGGGRMLPCRMVTAVTVRTSHRRRGILNRMMGEDLARARAAGTPVAALMASEATIYGRFGFGAAVRTHSVEVDVRGGLDLRPGVGGESAGGPAAGGWGTVVAVPPSSLADLHDDIFARAHAATPGSLGRQAAYRRRAAGLWGGPNQAPSGDLSPNRAQRAAVHLDVDGIPQGFVTHESTGWDETAGDGGPVSMKVTDLVAATPAARLALWRYLGAQDLVGRITEEGVALDDPLPLVLANPRRYRVAAREDRLWLRLLDVPAALEARPYAADGRVVLHVADPLGFADGTWELVAAGGAGTVHRLPGSLAEPAPPAECDVVLDAETLAELYLGGVRAAQLHAAGRISGPREPVAALDRIFATVRAPHCLTAF